MRLRQLGRIGTAGALTVAAAGVSIVFTPSMASAESAWQCYGKQVKRCATVWWDRETDTYRARAKITDVAGGGNYTVKVNDVKLLRFNGTETLTVKSAKDDDGWHGTEDLAGTASVNPCRWPKNSFQVQARFSWKEKGGTASTKTWRPAMGWGHMCD
ncbi:MULTISPECIES: hypothetical protein [Streptomyces]|uniref:Uncharacterized protein n=1 Tax=Streptomyces xanthii TaxID=2768069 RepID=A0A7H1B0I5_9ACTN|nr:hypothetical protein [Streptomyces xanthii]QNS02240.1 hypothetical protein IAG42_00530 [Streptomyces xanthii]